MISGYHQVMFNAVLENACSEQGARMSAMDSSSRNAGEMLDRLTLTYNRSLSLSLYLPHMCMRTHTKRKIYIYGHCDWKKGSLAWFWKTSMVNPLLMGLTCILWIRTKKLVTFYVLKYCSMFVTELVKHLSPPS